MFAELYVIFDAVTEEIVGAVVSAIGKVVNETTLEIDDVLPAESFEVIAT